VSGQVQVDFRDVDYQLLLKVDRASRADVTQALNLLVTFPTRTIECTGKEMRMPFHGCVPCHGGGLLGRSTGADGGAAVIAGVVDRLFRGPRSRAQ
jgi:hypothetical protein